MFAKIFISVGLCRVGLMYRGKSFKYLTKKPFLTLDHMSFMLSSSLLYTVTMILNSRLFCLHISSATRIIGCVSVSRLCGSSCMIGVHATTELHPLP